MNNLALIFKNEDRYDEAMELMRACVQLRKKILGVDHPYTVSSLKTLDEWQVKQTPSSS